MLIHHCVKNQFKSYNKPKAYEYAVKLSSYENPDVMTAVARVFKDTIADNFDFFKKAIWLNTPRSYYPNFKSFGEYLEKSNNMVLEKGILFLKIFLHTKSLIIISKVPNS